MSSPPANQGKPPALGDACLSDGTRGRALEPLGAEQPHGPRVGLVGPSRPGGIFWPSQGASGHEKAAVGAAAEGILGIRSPNRGPGPG
jgi:hypothetical protein